MTCTVKMGVTAQEFFACIEDQLLQDARLHGKKYTEREDLAPGFSYIKSAGKKSFSVSILRYEKLSFLETQEEGPQKLSRAVYRVRPLDNGKLEVTLTTTLLSKTKGKDGEERVIDDSKNDAQGQNSLLYRFQLKSMERYIKKAGKRKG